MAKPSQGRVGIYIGESSRSLAERSLEHFKDAEAFYKKSHMVKHWMITHGEMETLPPFRIKVIKQYQDCLSRQVGEAIQILLSNDQLLNSKNEYIQNCISRITVQEDQYERRARLTREDEEEKQLETDMLEFKARKKSDKRKPNETSHHFQSRPKKMKLDSQNSSLEEGTQVHGVAKEGRNEADPPEREVGVSPSLLVHDQVQEVCLGRENVADPPAREVGSVSSQEGGNHHHGVVKTGQTKLIELRKRMEKERQSINRYMDNKKRAKIWREEPILPTGWTDWWYMVNLEEEKQARRNLKVQKAGNTKKKYKDRVIPNLALVGWRSWWSRMEAEGRKEGKERRKKETIQKAQSAKERMIPIETYFRNLKTNLEPRGIESSSAKFSSFEYSSPKRKLVSSSLSISAEPSPSKRRKLNFRENLSFWRKIEGEGGIHSQNGVKISTVQKFSKDETHTSEQDNKDVVIWRENPGSEREILSGGCLGRTINH